MHMRSYKAYMYAVQPTISSIVVVWRGHCLPNHLHTEPFMTPVAAACVTVAKWWLCMLLLQARRLEL